MVVSCMNINEILIDVIHSEKKMEDEKIIWKFIFRTDIRETPVKLWFGLWYIIVGIRFIRSKANNDQSLQLVH